MMRTIACSCGWTQAFAGHATPDRCNRCRKPYPHTYNQPAVPARVERHVASLAFLPGGGAEVTLSDGSVLVNLTKVAVDTAAGSTGSFSIHGHLPPKGVK